MVALRDESLVARLGGSKVAQLADMKDGLMVEKTAGHLAVVKDGYLVA